MADSTVKSRWYRLTPNAFMAILLAVGGFLFFSQRFQWGSVIPPTGVDAADCYGELRRGFFCCSWFGSSSPCFAVANFYLGFGSLLPFVVVVACIWLPAKWEKARTA